MTADWGKLLMREKQYFVPLLFTPSGEQDGNALIYTGPCLLGIVRLNTNGAADATISIYDGVDNSGGAGARVDKYPISGPCDYGGISFGIGAGKMDIGIYCELTGAGALYYIWYAEIQ